MSSSLVKPVETPCTAFAASARVSPCSAACSSESRSISSIPAFCSTLIPSGIGTSSVPLGPCTFSWSPIWIFTPEGTGIGFFPTLDICLLPNLAQNFPADAFLARRPARHHAPRRGQDADSEAALHPRYVCLADVRPATGARHALDSGHDRRIVRRILQVDPDDLFQAVVLGAFVPALGGGHLEV